MTEKFHGTGVALATPMNTDFSIDYAGVGRLIDHVIEGGVDYLVLMGTTGEASTVSEKEKLELLDYVIDFVSGRKPLVLGLGSNNTTDVIEKLAQLKGKKIDAILSANPYYNKPSQEGIFLHYQALADASSSPVMIYNVPHRSSSNILAETSLRLAEHQNIIGIKEASGDLFQCGIIARDKPEDFLLLSGDDNLTLPILSIGGNGVISVVANAYPKQFSAMVRAAMNQEVGKSAKMHQGLLELFSMSVLEGNPSSIKAALKAMNICETTVRLPLAPASSDLVAAFKDLKV